MHLFDVAHRLLGGYGIVGGQIPPATGAALAIDLPRRPGPDAEAVMCQLGDGTTNIGAFHESLNLAALWKLPIVYVIVNNRLGMGTTVEKAAAEPDLYKRGCAVPDARRARRRQRRPSPCATRRRGRADAARAERQPSCSRRSADRLRGHSVVDPAKYRTAEEVERLRDLDPLPRFGPG